MLNESTNLDVNPKLLKYWITNQISSCTKIKNVKLAVKKDVDKKKS
jgi:hypothetical protein